MFLVRSIQSELMNNHDLDYVAFLFLLFFLISSKMTAKSEIQRQLWQEGSISAECYENLLPADKRHTKKLTHVNKGTN